MSPLRSLVDPGGPIDITRLQLDFPKKHPVYTRTFDLIVENTGQANMREFKLQVEFFTSPDSVPSNPSMVRKWAFRDGQPDPRNKGKYNEKERLPVNIYPENVFPVQSFRITSTLPSQYVLIKWTLYLGDEPPASGQINLADECKQDYDEEVPDSEDRVPPLPVIREF